MSNNAVTRALSNATGSLYDILASENVGFILVQLALWSLCAYVLVCVARLVVALISPKTFGGEHRHTLRGIARRCLALSLAAQLAQWLMMDASSHYFRVFDRSAALALGVLALLRLLLAAVTMFTPRGGKRVFIARGLMNDVGWHALAAALLLLAGWYFG